MLPLADPAGRVLVPAGSAGGDCLAALEAVTAGLRSRFPAVAAVTAHEVAAHLSGGLWLAPGGAGVGVQHDPAFRGRRHALVIMPGGSWSGYPVMNRALRGGMT